MAKTSCEVVESIILKLTERGPWKSMSKNTVKIILAIKCFRKLDPNLFIEIY